MDFSCKITSDLYCGRRRMLYIYHTKTNINVESSTSLFMVLLHNFPSS